MKLQVLNQGVPLDITVHTAEHFLAALSLTIGEPRIGLKSAKIFDDLVHNIYQDNGEKFTAEKGRILRIKLSVLYGYWLTNKKLEDNILKMRFV